VDRKQLTKYCCQLPSRLHGQPTQRPLSGTGEYGAVLQALPFSCIIKLIKAVIYGFHNKLECLSLNTRLGWKGLPGTNTQTYYEIRKLRP